MKPAPPTQMRFGEMLLLMIVGVAFGRIFVLSTQPAAVDAGCAQAVCSVGDAGFQGDR